MQMHVMTTHGGRLTMNTTRLRFRGPVLVEELALELELEVAPALVMTMELMRGSTLAKEARCHWANNGCVSAGASTCRLCHRPCPLLRQGSRGRAYGGRGGRGRLPGSYYAQKYGGRGRLTPEQRAQRQVRHRVASMPYVCACVCGCVWLWILCRVANTCLPPSTGRETRTALPRPEARSAGASTTSDAIA